MNVDMGPVLTREQKKLYSKASPRAKKLVDALTSAATTNGEMDNRTAVHGTRVQLLAYIAELEGIK